MSKFFYISRSRSRSRSMQTLNISTRSSHHGVYTSAIWNLWVGYLKRYEGMSKFFYISRSRSRSRSRSMQTLNISTRSRYHGLYTCAIWNLWVGYLRRYEGMSKFLETPARTKGSNTPLPFGLRGKKTNGGLRSHQPRSDVQPSLPFVERLLIPQSWLLT